MYSSSPNQFLSNAVQAIIADNRDEARNNIESYLLDHGDSADAWLIQAWTSDSLADSEAAINRALNIEPDNSIAVAALSWISGLHAVAERQVEADRQVELERLESERLEAERLEQERLEAERLEHERLEQERIETERLEQDRLEAERLEAERVTYEQQLTEAASLEVEADLQQTIEGLADEVREEIEHETEAVDEMPAFDPDREYVILAVDDSPTIRKLVALTLEEQGFKVISAADGIEALNILADQLPDLILSDINMPRLGGYKLCKFIKKHERTASVPVVMLSGKDGVFDKMRGKMSGCDDFIAKPFEAAELVAKVREHIAVTQS
ncbi:MAG: response regulator [Pirellulaceae bacterium]